MHHLHAWASKKLCSMENTDIFKTFATKKFKSTAYFPITIEHHACLSVKPNIIPSVTIYRPSCLINSWPWTQQFNKSFKYTAKKFPQEKRQKKFMTWNQWCKITTDLFLHRLQPVMTGRIWTKRNQLLLLLLLLACSRPSFWHTGFAFCYNTS